MNPRFVLGLCAMIAAAGHADAALTACAGGALNSFSGGNPTNGCGQVDLGFSNFTESGGTVPTSSVDISTPASVTGGGTTINDIDQQLASSVWSTPSSLTISQYNFLTQVIGAPDGGDSPAPPFTNWGITGISVPNPSTASMTGIVDLTVGFCLGSTTYNCAGGSPNLGHITVDDNNGVFTDFVCVPTESVGGCTTMSGNSVTFLNSYVNIAMQVEVFQSGNGTVQDFDTDFSQTAETPEPASIVLAGAALAALGIFRLRKA